MTERRTITLEFYGSRTLTLKERYRWRVFGSNGEPLARSSEGYRSTVDCEHSANLVVGMWREGVEIVYGKGWPNGDG